MVTLKDFTNSYAAAVKEVNLSDRPDKAATLNMINNVYQEHIDKHYPGKTTEQLAKMVANTGRGPKFWIPMYTILLVVGYLINR